MSGEYSQLDVTDKDIARLDLIRHLDAVASIVDGKRVQYHTGEKMGKMFYVRMSSAIWALAFECSTDRAKKMHGQDMYSYAIPFKRARSNRKPMVLTPKLIPGFDAASHGWEEVEKGVYNVAPWKCDLVNGTCRRRVEDGIEVGHHTFFVHGATYPMVATKSIMHWSKVITVVTPAGREVKIEWRYENAAEIAKRVHEASTDKMDWFIDAKRNYSVWKDYVNNRESVTFSLAE